MSAQEQNARSEAQRAALKVEAGEKEVARLQAEMNAAQQRLSNTPRVAEQLDALEREYAQLGESFKDMSNKRLEAVVAANMERRQKGEQFRVLEPAYAPPSPTSPNRALILALDGETIDGVVFKCTPGEFDDLTDIDGVTQAPYCAKRHWVRVGDLAALPASEMERRIRRSYDLVVAKLPKKVRATLQ